MNNFLDMFKRKQPPPQDAYQLPPVLQPNQGMMPAPGMGAPAGTAGYGVMPQANQGPVAGYGVLMPEQMTPGNVQAAQGAPQTAADWAQLAAFAGQMAGAMSQDEPPPPPAPPGPMRSAPPPKAGPAFEVRQAQEVRKRKRKGLLEN